MTNHNPPTNGFDKRPEAIWKKGRVKSFDSWRAMLTEIAAEPAIAGGGLDNNGKEKPYKLVLIRIPKLVDGRPVLDEYGAPVMVDHYATNAEMVARSWMKDPKRQPDFIENTFGKVPQAVEMTGKDGGAIETKVTNDAGYNRAISTLADALRTSLSGAGDKSDSKVEATK